MKKRMIFFILFWETDKLRFYKSTKSIWNTSSKSVGSSSTQTTVSADRIALRAREWANLLPSLLTCWKLILLKLEQDSWISLITWPKRVRFSLLLEAACTIRMLSPSTIIEKRLNSLAKTTALLQAKASTASTEWGSRIFWLRATIISPSLSRTTTPILAMPELPN